MGTHKDPNLLGDSDWWRSGPIYEIYVRSFCDSNGDGIGDLKGIQSKLDYLKWLGIRTIWLTPIYKSPMVDFGYDVLDYFDVDPLFGTMDDFKDLRKAMASLDMKLIMDFIPNHTSDQHKWFLASVERSHIYDNYYVWHDGKIDPKTGTTTEPNNWKSCFGGSAWTWHSKRQQYYLHSFLKEQPDLNYRNPLVLNEMFKIMRFWLDLGVDGFRFDAINHIMHDDKFRDNEIFTKKEEVKKKETQLPEESVECESFAEYECDDDNEDAEGDEDEENKLKSVLYDKDQDELFPIVEKIKQFLHQYSVDKNRYVACLTEAYVNFENLKKFYYRGIDVPFNFSLIGLKHNNFHRLRAKIEKLTRFMKEDGSEKFWPNWVTDNHDQKRLITRLKAENEPALIDMANMLLLLLPGARTCYYGQELGLPDVPVTFDQCQDPAGKRYGRKLYAKYTRDPCRSPMPWTDSQNGGFSLNNENIEPWLPLAKNYKNICWSKQMQDTKSHLHFFKELIEFSTHLYDKLQDYRGLEFVEFRILNRTNVDEHKIVVFRRRFYIVVMNFGAVSVNLSILAKNKDEKLENNPVGCLIFHTFNNCSYKKDELIALRSLEVSPYQGLVFKM